MENWTVSKEFSEDLLSSLVLEYLPNMHKFLVPQTNKQTNKVPCYCKGRFIETPWRDKHHKHKSFKHKWFLPHKPMNLSLFFFWRPLVSVPAHQLLCRLTPDWCHRSHSYTVCCPDCPVRNIPASLVCSCFRIKTANILLKIHLKGIFKYQLESWKVNTGL